MIRNKKILFAVLTLSAGIVLFSSCKKSEEFVNPVYECGCGNLVWAGVDYPLLDANYVLADTSNELSRRYYITAKVPIEGEKDAHNVNLTLEIEQVDDAIFFVEDGTVFAEIKEINFNNSLQPERTFYPVGGVVNIAPAILGGTETVSFNLILKEYYNGTLVGFNVPFTGSFTVNVTL